MEKKVKEPKKSKKENVLDKEERKEKKKNPYHIEYGLFSNLKFIFGKLFHYDKFFFFLIPLGMVTTPIMRYLWTFLLKFIIDFVTQGRAWTDLLVLMLIFAGTQTAVTLADTYFNSEPWWRLIPVRMRMLVELNRKSMTIDFEHLENPDVMDCHQKAHDAAGGNSNGIEGQMRQSINLLTTLMVVIVGVFILSSMNLYIILLMIVISFINFIVSNIANKVSKFTVWDRLAPWWRRHWYIQSTTTDFSAAKDIRMFGLRDWLLTKYRELNKIRLAAQKRNAKIWFITSCISNLLWIVSQGFVYFWLIRSVVQKEIGLGDFSLYLASSGTFFQYISNFLNMISGLLARNREVDDFRSFLDFNGGDREDLGVPVPESDSYEFVFENVSFQYPKAEKYALEDLNLTLKAGERLAVVGLNGAGKTTMIKLLLRLYRPTKGRILLNGQDIQTFQKKSYYRIFAPVFQQVELFAFPMAQNVSMKTAEDTVNEKALQSLRDAGLTAKVSELPKGIHTELLKIIDEEGVDLSGGEKQKLALARALYKDAPVVVLDEPTAALDALAEAKLYADFDKLIGKKTSVYISHRLSSTQFCNHVAMFRDGKMVEYGTHESLMRQDGEYAKMFHVQAQYYVNDETEAV